MDTRARYSPNADVDKAMEDLQQLLDTLGDPDHDSVTSLPTSSPDRSTHVRNPPDPQLERSSNGGLSMSPPGTPTVSITHTPPDHPTHPEQGRTLESLGSTPAEEANRSPESGNPKPGNSVTFSLPDHEQNDNSSPADSGISNNDVGKPVHLQNSDISEADIKPNITERNWRDSMDEPRLLPRPLPTDTDATHLSVSKDNVFAGKQKHEPGKASVGNGTPTREEVDVPRSYPIPRTLDQTDGTHGDYESTSESGSFDITPDHDDPLSALKRKEEQMKLVDKLFPDYPDEVPEFSAPDGGYAWVILAASFLLQALTVALPLSFGVLYLELLSYFEDSNTKTAWIGSIAAGFGLGAGPISSILCNYLGYRLTCVIGGIVAAVGLFVSSFAPNLYMLYGSFGVLTGLGVSIAYIPAVVIIGYYFDKRRSMANGIACAGVAAGTLVYPLLMEVLIISYTWRGAMIVLSGVMLNCCVLGLLLRPTRYCKQFRRIGKTHSVLNCALFSDWRFCLFCLSEILWNIGSLVFLTSVADHAYLKGTSEDKSALLLSITGIGGLIGRIVMALATNSSNCNRLLCLAVATLVTVLPMALFTVSDLYPVLVVHCLVYGLGFGFQLGLLAVVTTELFTLEKLASAYGYVMFADGIGGFIGPIVTGVLFDHSKTYFPALLFGASVSLLAAVIFFILVVDQFRQRKDGGEWRERPQPY